MKVIRADGGGPQTITLVLNRKTAKSVQYVVVHQSESPDVALAAFSLGEPQVYESLSNLDKSPLTFDVNQQYSYSESAGRRTKYTQTFRHVVINVNFVDGTSMQRSVELPPYARPITINLSQQP